MSVWKEVNWGGAQHFVYSNVRAADLMNERSQHPTHRRERDEWGTQPLGLLHVRAAALDLSKQIAAC